jgi:hypothetical protein
MSLLNVLGAYVFSSMSHPQGAILTVDALDAHDNAFVCAPFNFAAAVERAKWVTTCGAVLQVETANVLVSNSVFALNFDRFLLCAVLTTRGKMFVNNSVKGVLPLNANSSYLPMVLGGPALDLVRAVEQTDRAMIENTQFVGNTIECSNQTTGVGAAITYAGWLSDDSTFGNMTVILSVQFHRMNYCLYINFLLFFAEKFDIRVESNYECATGGRRSDIRLTPTAQQHRQRKEPSLGDPHCR